MCSVIRMFKIRNEYIIESLSVTNIARKIIENRLKLFGPVERKNINNMVKKIGKLKVEGNWGRSRPQKKWMGVIGEDMRACDVNKNMFRDREWRERI